jgi:copper chaperone CopZ
MKSIIFLFSLSLFTLAGNAQFKTASLQATGLTCAMCSKAINNSLEKLNFVQSVDADIKNSVFNIVFKPNSNADIDQLQKAVEAAGFAIGKLKLVGSFSNVAVKNNEHIRINNKAFHFLKVNDQVLNGDRQITIVDKNFLTPKEFRKFSTATKMECVHTGKASGCCKKEGLAESTRIYHATI